MTSDGQPVERLRDYLGTLKPEARAMLIAELERGLLRGEEDVAGLDLVLQELRRMIRAARQPVERLDDAARLFFAPFEPFLIDDAVGFRRIGRIGRNSVDRIWKWIGRDLIPAEAKALSEDINRAVLAQDRTKAEQLTRALHERALQRIREAVAAAGADEKARRRLAVHVGTSRALDDLGTLTGILAIRDVLADLARLLPGHMRALERDQIDQIRALLASTATRKAHIDAARNADIFRYGLILVTGRLAAPWQIIRVATYAADSDDAARIMETPYAVAVKIALGEVAGMVDELRCDLEAHLPVVSLLRGIHDAVRGLRTELDLSFDSVWSRQLATIRTEVSTLLETKIESTPGRVRRLLRPRSAREITPGSQLDAIDVSEAEMLVEFIGACRTYAHELAINEVTTRAYSELQQHLESSTRVLLDALRHSGDADRSFRQSQVEAAIRFCKVVFGGDYAALLAKAAELAAQAGSAERETVRSVVKSR